MFTSQLSRLSRRMVLQGLSCSDCDSVMRSSGLSSVLPKLGAVRIGGGALTDGAEVLSRENSSTGSDDEWWCLFCTKNLSVARKPGLEGAVCRRDANDDGEAGPGLSAGVRGQSGFAGSRMGVDMLGLLSTEEPREDRDDGPLPLIDSVSFVHEKEREERVACFFFPGEPGGLTSPMGIRWSTSLYEWLNMRIVSSSSIVATGAQCGGAYGH